MLCKYAGLHGKRRFGLVLRARDAKVAGARCLCTKVLREGEVANRMMGSFTGRLLCNLRVLGDLRKFVVANEILLIKMEQSTTLA
jgi:hypothetical protein